MQYKCIHYSAKEKKTQMLWY